VRDLRAINWVIRETGSGTRRRLEELAVREGLSLDDLNIVLVLASNGPSTRPTFTTPATTACSTSLVWRIKTSRLVPRIGDLKILEAARPIAALVNRLFWTRAALYRAAAECGSFPEQSEYHDRQPPRQ
jgi:hypothetical protein